MSAKKELSLSNPVRQHKRVSYPPRLSVRYEGRDVDVRLSGPDISVQGMFINTPALFQEGAVLKVTFQLPRQGSTVVARCEVRYCLPGVGIGVEFINLCADDLNAIEQEIEDLQGMVKA
jgi:hypothetical protein